jgi:aspartyl-tRNA synthetase
MPATTPALRHCLRSGASRALWQRVWAIPSLHLACITSRRCFYDGGQSLVVEEVVADDRKRGVLKKYIDEYKTSCMFYALALLPRANFLLVKVPKPDFFFPKDIAHSQIGQTVTAVGFLAKRRDIGRALTFVPLLGGNGERVQVFARAEVNDEVKQALRQIPENSAVSVTGVLGMKYEEKEPKKNPGSMKRREGHCLINEVEIRVQKIDCLSSFPKELKHQPNHQYEPRHRHLQLRFDEKLSERLRFRSEVAAFARRALSDFQEVETPILFKSTPEGAREFIVPTRRRGYAYGLPQSPQQYKQILMASGIYRYFQFAKCFRDEDHRADRQPEFTQVSTDKSSAITTSNHRAD